MTTTTSPRLLIAFVLLPIWTITHAAEHKAIGIKDGLELIVSTVIHPDSGLPFIECRLHNTTDQDIPFDLTSTNYRLSFSLENARGSELPMDKEWKRLNAPTDAEMGFSRHCSSAVQPGKDWVFSFRPDEAYRERWKQAARLVVNWEPGIDWSTEKPYTKGRGLTVNYEIPKEDHHISAALPAPVSAQGSNPGTKPKQVPPNTQPSAQAPLTVIVGLFISGLVLLWLVRMRRSRMRNTASNIPDNLGE